MNQSKRVVNSLNKLPDSGEKYPESLEVSGLNEQKKQSGNRGKPRKQSGRLRFSHKTILSLCLISGLSVGVGTAFANDVLPPDKFRSLEPAANVKMEEELDLPPKDPELETSNNQKIPSDKSSGQNAYTDNKNNSDYNKDLEKNKNQSAGVNNSSKPTVSKSSPPQATATEQKKSETTSIKQDGEKKALTTNLPTEKTTPTKPAEAKKSTEGDQTPTPSPPPIKPITEKGGKLPDTAGRDLEGVLFGGLVAILGTLYILLKGRKAKRS